MWLHLVLEAGVAETMPHALCKVENTETSRRLEKWPALSFRGLEWRFIPLPPFPTQNLEVMIHYTFLKTRKCVRVESNHRKWGYTKDEQHATI